MQERDNLWAEYAEGDFYLETIAVINETEYTEITAPIISRGLFQGSPSVGNCTAASLQLSIRTEDEIQRSAEVEIKKRLYAERGGTPSDWISAGTFYVSARGTDYSSDLVSMQCYDAMLKTRENYFPAEAPIMEEWPQPMSDVVDAIAARIGVEVDPRTTIRTEARYVMGAPIGMTMMDVLSRIGEVHGGNWIITPDNKLRLVCLSELAPPDDLEEDGVPVIAVLQKLDRGRPLTITKVSFVSGNSGDGDEAEEFYAGDDSGYTLTITGNPYASQDIADDLYATIGGLVYVPYTMDGAIYDPAAELGDTIVYNDIITAPIVQQNDTLDVAFRGQLGAPVDTNAEDEYPYLSEVERTEKTVMEAIAQVEETLAEEVSDAAKKATNYIAQDATGLMVANMTEGTQTPSEATGNNVLIDSQSVRVRDGTKDLATYSGEGISFDEDTPYKIGNDETYIEFVDEEVEPEEGEEEEEEGETRYVKKLHIVADSISFRSGADVKAEMERMASDIDENAEATNSLRNETEDALNGITDEMAAQNEAISEAQESANILHRYININPAVPSISLGTGEDTRVDITSERLSFIAGGVETGHAEAEGADFPTVSIANLYYKTTDATTGDEIGQFGWVMRTNGHLSLKILG